MRCLHMRNCRRRQELTWRRPWCAHRWLAKTFGYVVRQHWQLDTFGHSGATAALSALGGMDSVFFSRLDKEVCLCSSACDSPWLAGCRLMGLLTLASASNATAGSDAKLPQHPHSMETFSACALGGSLHRYMLCFGPTTFPCDCAAGH